MAGEKYTNIGKARWENANVGVIKWDPENKAGVASVIDETTGTVYEIGGGSGGGGEDSDFTTAEVTFLNSLGDGNRGGYLAQALCLLSDGMAFNEINVPRNGEITVTMPLYKGKTSIPEPYFFLDNVDIEVMPQLTGGVEFSGMNVVITGDCTINCAGGVDSDGDNYT